MKLGTLAGILNRTTVCLPITLMLFYAGSLMASHSLHTNFIKKDGSFWSAGNNSKGQLGDGTTTDRSSPVQALFGGVIAVSSGEYHTMFIKKDFTLWGIGQNGNGQLGDGSTTDRSTPVQITSNVHSVSCGYQHTIFLKRDGSLWGMGGNHIGQLGDATVNDHHSPVQIESSGVVSIAAGGYNTYYIKSNGSLWGTGYNQHGPIGDGTTTHVTTPYQIKPSGVKQVSAGAQHSAFLMTDGSLWTSGGNAEGQLGNGTTSGRQTHAQVIASGIKSISLGWYTTFFIKEDGSLWAAGLNSLGRLGDGTTTNRSTPVQIISSSVTQVSTGIEHSTVLKTDGSVWAFGENSDGRLGIGNTSNASSPTEITGFNGVHRLADVVPNHLVELNSSVDLEMIWVQPGSFIMGASDISNASPEHNVTLTKGFYLGKYEVTQAQYEAVMIGNDQNLSTTPSVIKNNPNHPVVRASWDDIQVFLDRLNDSQSDKLPNGWVFALPTEAEWEYACRAGTGTDYSWGDNISTLNANFQASGYSLERQVGQYSANPWGFFDMHGNVREWTSNWYVSSYAGGSQIDPQGPLTGSERVDRGGSWFLVAGYLKSAARLNRSSTHRSTNTGFRLSFKQLNSFPNNLASTAPLAIAENQPIGTVVGEFNATDPDINSTLTYQLVSGVGDGNNSLFTLDTNGTLMTAITFDYESNASTYSIRVHAKDEFNASVEGNFTVSLTDIYEPSQPNHLVDLNSSVNLEMIWVEPGTFTMGSPVTELGRGTDETEHNVTLTKGFYLGKYEVTQAQYEAVMTGNINGLSPTPSFFSGNPNRPVEKVSWDDIQTFLTCLNANEQAAGRLSTGWSYVLPTEAQWEYACRAGSTTVYSWGDVIDSSKANYNWDGGKNDGVDYKKTREVGKYSPNSFGFHDMHGNLWEWVDDYYFSYTGISQIDPSYNHGGTDRVLRGGPWLDTELFLRSAKRYHRPPTTFNYSLGFRLCFQYTNKTPRDLNVIGSLNFPENQPAGSIVGEFNATDPDVNATLTYHLVSGAGDTHNTLFTLDTNGTLKTATVFDYEINASTYTIRVQAKDEFNATVEGNFTVMLTDVYEPSQPNHFVDLNSSVNLEMIWVEPGTFTMGSPVTEVGREDDENQTLVTLTKGFYLGKYEVTQAQYEAVMTGNSSGLSADPSQFKASNRPVEEVSWEDAQVFLTRLNEAEQMAGRLPVGWSYFLPTESQWEYACRAGKNTEYSLGNVITSSNVNYNRIIGQTTNVGTYAPNYWGFYDMHGNVLEWTADWYQVAYPIGNPVIDPIGPSSGSYRVLRGGSWVSEGTLLRSAKRFRNWRIHSANDLGFRIAFQQVTTPPTNLNSTAPLTIAENQPIGTVVGEFSATDPDVNAILTYHLVTGAGDTHNSLFTLETNGTLRTATIFDYKSNASNYSIRVQVRDEFNATTEGNFTVLLTDIYEPSLPNHTVDLNSTVNLEMIWVEPGTFTMGSPEGEVGRGTDETEHNVTLTKGFYLGKYEVTQAQYEAVMSGNTYSLSATPSNWPNNPNRPVEMVSWDDVQIFLSRLNASEQEAGRLPAGWSYVLPTESQWEYACRAGTTAAYSWGATIDCSNANYSSCGYSQTRDVGMYGANPWGFADMHGNVYEWTADWYDATYPTGNPEIDPTGPASGSSRVRRGGSWTHGGSGVRSAKRGRSDPSTRIRYTGFRVGFQNTNNPPEVLHSTTPLTIAENQPIGTVVGEFSATDPDVGATLTYHLANGAGDGNNSLFTLETNGTIKTATIFDYEINASTYTIRVQAKDEFNATVEGNFTVTLTDQNDPTTGAVTLLGTPVVGQILTASNSLADEDGLGTITYQWYRSAGALPQGLGSGSIYTLTAADLGKTISVVASYTDNGAFDHNVSSSGTALIQPVYVSSQANHTVELNATANLEMIWVEPGTFMMGSPLSEMDRRADEVQHQVTLTEGFYLGKFEVTQAQYQAVMTGNAQGLSPTPSNQLHPQYPVGGVSWNDIQIFLREINEAQREAGKLANGWAFVLPTEAQWEFACRAGTTTATSFGDSLSSLQANFVGSSPYGMASVGPSLWQTKEVGTYAPNPWGFFDMHGNAWEWTSDKKRVFDNQAVIDPVGPVNGAHRVRKGAGAGNRGEYLRAAMRGMDVPEWQGVNNGFRLAYKQITIPPNDLNATAPLTVGENQPVGTIVGEFIATDPDVNATLTYHLVSGAGDGNNSLFTLDANGILRTATVFNYETNATTYSIRVRASDEYNASVEGNFTVMLTDDLHEDTDGDGFSDAEELLAGTDAHDTSNKPGLDFGLVAYYPFDGNASDMSGNSHDGTVNGPTSSADRHGATGQAYAFDGVNDSILVPHSARLDLNGTDYSIGFWTRQEINSDDRSIIQKRRNESSWGISMLDGRPGYVQGGGNQVIDHRRAITPVSANQWVHVQFTYKLNDRTLKLFINGSRLHTWIAVDSPIPNNRDVTIGRRFATGGNAYHGSIDEVRIYNRALSSTEVLALYNLENTSNNNTPTGLNATAVLAFSENQPVGTRVGEFNATDPDGDILTYALVNGVGSADNAWFTLETNGTLRTATVFDFEKKNKYSIRVRTTDQFGGSFEKDFTIEIVDCFRPIVETRGVIDSNGTGYRFAGEVVDRGGLSEILEKGFVWSLSPRPMIDQNGSFKIVSNGLGLKFNSVVKDLIAGKKYFFRAYARNKEGVGYGSVLDLKTVRNISPWWIDARSGVAANWWTSSWLGSFYMNEANASWIMHSELGWLYPMASGKSGVWLWKENLGWLWTDEAFYPFLYQYSSAAWLYFYGASQDRLLFYHYRDERWLQKIREKMK